MATIAPCPACKKDVASDASTCPHCGHHSTPQISGFLGCLILVAVVLVIILGSCAVILHS